MRGGRKHAMLRRNESLRLVKKDQESNCEDHGDRRKSQKNNKSTSKRSELPKKEHVPANETKTNRRVSSTTTSNHQYQTIEILRDAIHKFDLSVICEDDVTQNSNETQDCYASFERFEVVPKDEPASQTQPEARFRVPPRSKDQIISKQLPLKEKIEIDSMMWSVLSAVISNAQLTQDETEIEVILENTEDAAMANGAAKGELNFVQKALLDLSCTKQHSVKSPSVLARITVHVVPPTQVPSDIYFKNSKKGQEERCSDVPVESDYQQPLKLVSSPNRSKSGHTETEYQGNEQLPPQSPKSQEGKTSSLRLVSSPSRSKSSSTETKHQGNKQLPPQSPKSQEGKKSSLRLESSPSRSKSGSTETKYQENKQVPPQSSESQEGKKSSLRLISSSSKSKSGSSEKKTKYTDDKQLPPQSPKSQEGKKGSVQPLEQSSLLASENATKINHRKSQKLPASPAIQDRQDLERYSPQGSPKKQIPFRDPTTREFL